MPSFTTPSVKFLTEEELHAAVAAAKDTATEIFTNPDGSETVRHLATPRSEQAMYELCVAFKPLIESVSRKSKYVAAAPQHERAWRYEEAQSICTETFIRAVREHDSDSEKPFSVMIRVILARALSDAYLTSVDLVSVKHDVAARYWALMDKYDQDAQAAYAECQSTANGFMPATFLAIHLALSGVLSIDVPIQDEHSDDYSSFEGSIESLLGDPAVSFEEDHANADLARWFLTKVNDRDAQMIRLRFGFNDDATETLRRDANLPSATDEPVLTNGQVGEAIGAGTSTVRRRIEDVALPAMRAAADEAVNA